MIILLTKGVGQIASSIELLIIEISLPVWVYVPVVSNIPPTGIA